MKDIELLPCPFCGRTPHVIERPDNIDGTRFFFGVACYCGGHSACAHKMAIRDTAEQAKTDASILWNARAAVEANRVPGTACHPMQPVVIARDKCHRFLENRMVSHLYEWARDRGMGLNEMAGMGFSDEDRMQFAQLIGYSVSGYGDLGYVSNESYEEAASRSAMLSASPAQQKQSGWSEESGLVLDFANRVELACYNQGSDECMAAVQRILDGKDNGEGIANEPWESLRRRLLELVTQQKREPMTDAAIKDQQQSAPPQESQERRHLWDGSPMPNYFVTSSAPVAEGNTTDDRR